MDDLQTFITLLLAVITLSTAAGVGFQRGKIGQLRGELAEERERGEATKRELQDSITEAKRLRTDLDALSRVVTGEAHWTAIGQQLDEHHNAAQGHWHAQDDKLERIASAVERTAGR